MWLAFSRLQDLGGAMADDLVGIPENPVPAGAAVVWLTAVDGVRLRAVRFPATAAVPRGTICLFQGRTEFIEKYFETIGDLRKRGFAVATLDWRGQGLSQRRWKNRLRGHVGNFNEFQRDLDVFMQDFALPECPPPFYALAHSMGGNILLHGVRRRPLWFERLVLSAPMIGLPGAQEAGMARTVATVAVACGLGSAFVPGAARYDVLKAGFEGNPLTGDAARFARLVALFRAAPQLFIGAPTFGWARAAFRAMATLQDPRAVADVALPALIVAAGADKVVGNAALAALARRLRTGHLITLDGSRHEILMERDAIRAAFFAAFDAFVPGTDPFPGDAVDPL
jgi:lysophospholipase